MDVISAFKELPVDRRDNNLKVAITGGAPCSPALMKDFKATFPVVKLRVGDNPNVSADLKLKDLPLKYIFQ